MSLAALSDCFQSNYLSANVHRLICVDGVAEEQIGQCDVGITNQGTLDWDYVKKQFTGFNPL